MKSRKALYEALMAMKTQGWPLSLPTDYKEFRNEVYGKTACIIITGQIVRRGRVAKRF